MLFFKSFFAFTLGESSKSFWGTVVEMKCFNKYWYFNSIFQLLCAEQNLQLYKYKVHTHLKCAAELVHHQSVHFAFISDCERDMGGTFSL